MVFLKKYVPIAFILLSCILFFSFEALANFDIEKSIEANVDTFKQFTKDWWPLLILIFSSACIGIDWHYHNRLTGLAIALSLFGSGAVIYFAFSA